MGTTEEPILCRIDRLDNMLRQLEEIRSSRTSGSVSSNDDLSPKHCRPIEDVMMETEAKGTVIERLNQVEHRLLKLEEEWKKVNSSSPKKGLKQFVKQCVKGGAKIHI